MVNIGSTDFYISVPSLPRQELKKYSTLLFDDWEHYVESVLELSDYSLSLNVEEGSITARGIVTTTLGVLFIGIGQYGSFVSGLQTINSQIRSAGAYLGERAATPFQDSNAQPKVRRRGETLVRLQNLFVKVQRGEITVQEAMRESEVILGSEAETAPEFMDKLKESLEQTPLLPQQMELPLVSAEGEELIIDPKKQRKQRPTQPKEPTPDPEQFRIEVWRESRKGKRKVRVVSL